MNARTTQCHPRPPQGIKCRWVSIGPRKRRIIRSPFNRHPARVPKIVPRVARAAVNPASRSRSSTPGRRGSTCPGKASSPRRGHLDVVRRRNRGQRINDRGVPGDSLLPGAHAVVVPRGWQGGCRPSAARREVPVPTATAKGWASEKIAVTAVHGGPQQSTAVQRGWTSSDASVIELMRHSSRTHGMARDALLRIRSLSGARATCGCPTHADSWDQSASEWK